ncbi:LapA family protein [Sulfurihydrogenibium subterraneum]|uniref:LapA family protein n=1 Tax=Sulfurihydrogenibium subterraneum TaxID=171121 RepID=UPI0004914CB1|nr:LapA family protein [Sulfurihydrogenibium subterraneum]
MLSKIRFVIWLIILLLVAYFVAMNTTSVSVNLIPGYQTVPMPLSIVIIFSAVIGAIFALTLTIGDWIKFKMEISKLNKQLQNCEKEKQVLMQSKNLANQQENSQSSV